jgi:uncharacterized protein involved in cysteine biosynthesis
LAWFTGRSEQVLAWLLYARPEGPWYALGLYMLCKALLYVAVIVLTLVAAMLVMNIAAAPVYDRISAAVERDLTGREPPPLGLAGNLRVILVELKKVVLILGISILLLCIPGLNVVSTLSAAFLVGWDFFDYPVARRGWTLGQRLRLVTREFWAVLGFGLWLVIPFAQVVMVPLAVAGGTMLNLDALERQQRLTPMVPGRKGDDAVQ